ncbi:SGNH/GDSL hydrolase family protein [Streptomyces sp. NRRL WC-3742]|uniref:SGNH/GDSL hydrolase family protein n=1 Tax=Streptomyces sp. NRRL WC-3742 TaxID=1463934 RepID=UPI00068D5FC5|nr:SGNH/GDSL hydrolase family protein [Streptomyces sp. NRRL WC-3742]
MRRLALRLARMYMHLLAHRPPRDWTVPVADGRYGCGDGPLTLLMLGDSLAQGYGAQRPDQTLGALLAQGLAEGTGRPVDLRVHARVGATTAAVGRQVHRAARLRPGIAVLLVGGNDVLIPAPLGRAARQHAHLAQALRESGWQLVVVPCPNPGYGPGFRAPARWIGHHRSRRLARRHTRTADRLGAHLAPTSGPEFRDRAPHLLGPDGIHPSPHGYATHAARMLPTLLAAADRIPHPAPATT